MLRYYNELLYFAQKLIGNKDEARDLIQETYSRAIAVKAKSDIVNERAYLYKVAKNLATKESIDKGKMETIVFEEQIYVDTHTQHPEEMLVKEEQEAAFVQAVNALPPRAKEAFVLHTVDGYSRREIATLMGVTPNAVEKLIKRATVAIEEELAKKGF